MPTGIFREISYLPKTFGMLSVFTSRNVLLAGKDEPLPATIEVDDSTGKIVFVRSTYSSRSDYPSIADDHWVDVGEHCILPGLIE
jgi:allantoinase